MRTTMKLAVRRLLGMLLVAAVLLPAAHAQSRPPGPARPTTPTVMEAPSPASGKVDLELLVVHATQNGQVDAKLAGSGLVENLKFTRYSGFSVLDTHQSKVAPGSDASFSLVGGRKVQVTLIDRDSRAAKVRVLMFKGADKVMDTTVSIHRNRSFIIMGPDHDGGKLVLPLTVTY